LLSSSIWNQLCAKMVKFCKYLKTQISMLLLLLPPWPKNQNFQKIYFLLIFSASAKAFSYAFMFLVAICIKIYKFSLFEKVKYSAYCCRHINRLSRKIEFFFKLAFCSFFRLKFNHLLLLSWLLIEFVAKVAII